MLLVDKAGRSTTLPASQHGFCGPPGRRALWREELVPEKVAAGRKLAPRATRAPARVHTLLCVAARLHPFTVQGLLYAFLADPEGSEPLWDWNPGPQAQVQAASSVPGSPPPSPPLSPPCHHRQSC